MRWCARCWDNPTDYSVCKLELVSDHLVDLSIQPDYNFDVLGKSQTQLCCQRQVWADLGDRQQPDREDDDVERCST